MIVCFSVLTLGIGLREKTGHQRRTKVDSVRTESAEVSMID